MITLLSELTSTEGLTALADPHPISLTAPRAIRTLHHETANFYHELLCTLGTDTIFLRFFVRLQMTLGIIQARKSVIFLGEILTDKKVHNTL